MAKATKRTMTIDEAAATMGWKDGASFVARFCDEEARTSYSPSLYTEPRSRTARDVREAEACRILADAYDAEMARRGDSRRAYRGSRSSTR
jgi:hypothetical protein